MNPNIFLYLFQLKFGYCRRRKPKLSPPSNETRRISFLFSVSFVWRVPCRSSLWKKYGSSYPEKNIITKYSLATVALKEDVTNNDQTKRNRRTKNDETAIEELPWNGQKNLSHLCVCVVQVVCVEYVCVCGGGLLNSPSQPDIVSCVERWHMIAQSC